jgi:hypothetical protein
MTDSGEADTQRDTDEFEDEFDSDEFDEDFEDDAELEAEAEYDEYTDEAYEDQVQRPFRRGRGGFDPEAAALTARARYSFRQRVVVLMLMAAVISGLCAVTVSPMLWWVHAAIDIGLVGYLGYLRRQVRIEEEIRERRTARLASQRRAPVATRPEHDAHGPADEYEPDEVVEEAPQMVQRRPLTRHVHPGTVVVDTDDEDPAFAELDEPGALPYRRAVGE